MIWYWFNKKMAWRHIFLHGLTEMCLPKWQGEFVSTSAFRLCFRGNLFSSSTGKIKDVLYRNTWKYIIPLVGSWYYTHSRRMYVYSSLSVIIEDLPFACLPWCSSIPPCLEHFLDTNTLYGQFLFHFFL